VRTLLAHPVYVLALTALAIAVPAGAVDRLPLPIGPLSDYGAVLDRHGREEIDALIEETLSRTGIEVHILATWENPLPDARALAQALLSSWNLSSRDAVLAVFVRSGTNWSSAVIATDRLRGSRGPIDRDLEGRIADLVAHDRIKEAMLALFDGLLALAPQEGTSGAAGSGGLSPWISVPLVIGLVVVLSFWIGRHICPRCGSLLRRSAPPQLGDRRLSRGVYSCRRCGFRRER
jgi:predicted RNA-binding Zn-ribbon protein involved in translation (DUF1610 family)